MSSVLSNYLGNLMLQTYLSAHGGYLAAHNASPTALGDLSTEVAGSGYGRQPISFGPASNKTVGSTNSPTFTGMPACTVTDLAVWDAIANGHLLFMIHLVTPIPVLLNGHLLVAAGDVALTL